jgi:hypothetical protein
MSGQTANGSLARGRATRIAMALVIAAGCAAARAADDAGTRYAKLLADAESFTRYNSLVEQQLQTQQTELAEVQAQVAQIDATGAEVGPLLQRMFEQLEAFIAKDLPFVDPISDRKERIEKLRELMQTPDAPIGEKYRKLLEAYQIELEYGRVIEAYSGKLEDGREAEFVRVGRIALLYRTADGESGYWDMDGGKWVPDQASQDDVTAALRIAKKEIAPDVLEVPVPAAKEVGS